MGLAWAAPSSQAEEARSVAGTVAAAITATSSAEQRAIVLSLKDQLTPEAASWLTKWKEGGIYLHEDDQGAVTPVLLTGQPDANGTSATLLFLEWLAPGRVAMGEVFAYRNLRWELDLLLDQRLIARERYDLGPDNESLQPLRARFPAAYYLSIYAAGDFATAWPDAELDSLNNDAVYLGHGPLEGELKVIRALCADSIAARALATALRRVLYQSAGRIPPALGRPPD
jgi:hypothetical protein